MPKISAPIRWRPGSLLIPTLLVRIQHPLALFRPPMITSAAARWCSRPGRRRRRAQPVGQRQHLANGGGDQLGVAAESACPRLPGRPARNLRHPRQDRSDLAGHVDPDHTGRRRCVRIHTERAIRSAKSIAAARTAIRTSPRPTGESGRSSTWSTSGAPWRVITTAPIAASVSGGRQPGGESAMMGRSWMAFA